MFVGHSALALALVTLGALALGRSREQALILGVFAAGVAALPDVDMVYALSGLLTAASLDAFALADGFWAASTTVHRSVTHSLVLAVPVAAAIGAIAAGGRYRFAGLAGLGGLFAVVAAGATPVFGLVTAIFLLGAVGLGVVAGRHEIRPHDAGVTAAVALLSHPFGDLLTGTPPWMLYPFETRVVTERLTVATDPTLHLLSAFFVEIAAIWLAVLALAYVREWTIIDHLRPQAVLGGGYALAALVLPAPTLSVSYHFVFSVTAVGFVGALSRPRRSSWPTRFVTGLAAVTLAGVAYAVTYLLVGV